jgi:hypothetical protein
VVLGQIVKRSGDRVQYLSDMQEFDVRVSDGPPGTPRFAKAGNLGYKAGNPQSGRILVNGKESPKGLSMCPDSNTYARVRYRLDGKGRRFLATGALNDSAGTHGAPPGVGHIPTPLTFQVFGDGKLLWKSKPVDRARDVRECNVDVTGVAVLELSVDCPGAGSNAQAVWLEPRVELGDVQYLSGMEEFGVRVVEGRFAKHGNLGYSAGRPPSNRIVVDGKESPQGLSMCPASDTYARVRYRLQGMARMFFASAALNDSAGAHRSPPGVGRIPTPLTFQVFGDGRLLWKSKPVDEARVVQACKVDVTGVNVLELRVDCPGPGINAQAVWLDPRIEPARPAAERQARRAEYLSDMQELDVLVSRPPGRPLFGKEGDLGYKAGIPASHKIVVQGKEWPKGLSLVPVSNADARVSYNLEGKARVFLASAALNDSACTDGSPPGVGPIPTPITFSVLGDGRVLWESAPVDTAGVVQECSVDVSGVDVLELRVGCPGSNVNAQAVWLEPRVELK